MSPEKDFSSAKKRGESDKGAVQVSHVFIHLTNIFECLFYVTHHVGCWGDNDE